MAASPSVLRNALWLVGAQVLAAPLSVLVNAVIGRFLGPGDFGRLYLATTYASFALLFVEWGQFGTLTGKIAAQRDRAGELLGSAMVWRVGAAVVAAGAVMAACWLAGYERAFLLVMALSLGVASLGTVAGAGLDAVRGFERTDFGALCYLGQQVLQALVSVSILLLGLGLDGLLVGQIICALIGVCFVLYMLPRLQIPKLQVRGATVRELFRDGQVFLTFVIVVQLQPLVDGAMMAHFASSDSLGWYAASRKLIGILSFPAAAVGGALYPTLVRQIGTDRAQFRATVHQALRVLCLAVFPVCLGSALFPQLGVMIFNATTFAPAEDNVRVLALWLFLLYFTVPLSQCILASGRRAWWAGAQFGCVLISLLADPLLIRWFQLHGGNGGLGVCIANAGSEVLMLGAAVLLLPKGLLDGSVVRLLGRPAIAGGAMAAVALLLMPLNWPLAAALAVLAYIAVLLATGAFELREIRGLLRSQPQ